MGIEQHRNKSSKAHEKEYSSHFRMNLKDYTEREMGKKDLDKKYEIGEQQDCAMDPFHKAALIKSKILVRITLKYLPKTVCTLLNVLAGI